VNLSIDQLKIDTEKVSQILESFIKSSTDELHRSGAVLGLSGGIDSSLALGLTVAALGPNKVTGLIMPERDSQPDSENDARLHANLLGVAVEKIDLTPILSDMGLYQHIPKAIFSQKIVAAAAARAGYKLYSKVTGKNPFLSGLEGTGFGPLRLANAYYRMKHRLRMVLLYARAEHDNLLVVGTANKTEFLTGFFVQYGDSATDIMPLMVLYKTQVRQLAKFLGVPEKIIAKAPSPDLIPGITDEFALGITYDKLDLILAGLEMNLDTDDITRAIGIDAQKVQYVRELMQKSSHMRNAPLIPSAPIPIV
jgi:NAD+ synthase